MISHLSKTAKIEVFIVRFQRFLKNSKIAESLEFRDSVVRIKARAKVGEYRVGAR